MRNLSIGEVKLTTGVLNPPEMDNKFSIIDTDLRKQEEIVLISQPKAVMLKFILKWDDGFTTYLDGDIYVQSWTKYRSAETRLVCTHPYTKREYSNKEYELKMSYYNTIVRKQYYEYTEEINELILAAGGNLDDGIKYVCNCHDCISDLSIIADYIKNVNDRMNIIEIFDMIDANLYYSRNIWVKKLEKNFGWINKWAD